MELHEQDFYLWTKQTAELLEAGLWQKVDLTNLIAEIKDMGSNDKHALKSNLRILLIHLLKWQFQPAYRTNSWMSSIVEHRQRIEELLEKSPSLKPYLDAICEEVYPKAAKGAEKQTGLSLNIFPVDCPYTLQQILDIDLLPD